MCTFAAGNELDTVGFDTAGNELRQVCCMIKARAPRYGFRAPTFSRVRARRFRKDAPERGGTVGMSRGHTPAGRHGHRDGVRARTAAGRTRADFKSGARTPAGVERQPN